MPEVPKILYIDDEEDLLSLAESFFEDENLPIDISTNFHDALEKIKSTTYDLIISDARMPSGSGEELFQLIKSEGHFSGKFILVTGNMDHFDPNVPSEYDQVIYKPLRFHELVEKVKKLLVKL
jgi:DNA-binding response OmpR family regulator